MTSEFIQSPSAHNDSHTVCLPGSAKWMPFAKQLCLDKDVVADHRSLQQFADAAAVVEQVFFDTSQHEPDETQTAMVVEYFLLTCLSARPAEAL